MRFVLFALFCISFQRATTCLRCQNKVLPNVWGVDGDSGDITLRGGVLVDANLLIIRKMVKPRNSKYWLGFKNDGLP